MVKSINKKVLGQSILIFFFLVLCALFYGNTAFLFGVVKVYSIAAFVCFLLTNPFPLLSPYSFIMLFLYVYNCGELWLLTFGITLKDSSFSIKWFSQERVVEGFAYVLLFLMLIQVVVAARSCGKDYINTKKQYNSISDNDEILYEKKKIETVCTVLFPICFVLATIFDITQIRTSIQFGYLVALRTRTNSAVLSLANAFMPMLIIGLADSSTNSKKRKLVFIYGVLRYTVYMVIMGSRLLPISMYFCLMLVYFKNKIINLKQKIALVVVIILVIILGTFVAESRNANSSYSIAFLKLKANNPVLSMVQELGGTFIDVPLIIDNVDTIGYAYGKTYINMAINMIPKINLLLPHIEDYASFSSILNGYFFKGSGLGGSILAELYYNFGWFALFAAPVLALIYEKISELYLTGKPLQRIINLYLFLILAMYVRGTAGEVTDYFRIIIYYYFIYTFLVNKGVFTIKKRR